jgi:uncharacterized protein YfaS (alpha-2-macroglobulin family)
MKFKFFSFLVLMIYFLFGSFNLPAGTISEPQSYKTEKSSDQKPTRDFPFTFSWKQVDSLANLNQPQSALAIVNKIYAQAKIDKNDPQLIKAIIYTIRLNSDFQENFLKQTILLLQKEISVAGQPSKQILQSILAEVYWKFYQNNQYRYHDRTQVKPNAPDSIETWDLRTISGAITRTYLLSIEKQEILKSLPIGKFEAILNCEPFDAKHPAAQTAEAAKFYPTLYDFLAGRALDFFMANDATPVFAAQRFEVDKSWYFDQTIPFISNKILIPADSSSAQSFCLRIFRDLADFHSRDKDPRALIDVELKRFAFVHDEYILPGKDSLYLDALQQLEKKHIASPWSAGISYAIAGYLNSRGQLYDPFSGNAHKWEIRSAVEVCDNVVKRHPGSEGAGNCKTLLKSIKIPMVQITIENAVPVEKPSLALVQFSNLTNLFFRLIKTDPERYAEKSENIVPAEFFRYLVSQPVTKSWSQVFPSDGDFQKHSVEMSVPGATSGFYVLICSTSEDFKNAKQVFAYAPFWSTQISYISKHIEDGSLECYILDRETGLPLKNVKAEAWVKNWSYTDRKMVANKQQEFTSYRDGFFSIPSAPGKASNSTLYLKIHHEGDFLITDNFYRYPLYKSPDRTSLQTMFYTDRSIYRPGQIVYFKGIILEKTGDRSAIKANHPTKVVFTDVNGQKIAEQQLVSNEFGSFNGSFTTPMGVLLGQMTISNESGSVYISVEEYKRPTFDVTYEPLEGNYKLGESLTVSGKAMAFAGNAVDGASVKYRVVRNARFPFREWNWYMPMPVSPQVEITSGTTTTGPDGKFSLSFSARPDPTVDPKSMPVFDFTIYADVTDINSETQSAQQNVSVGYNSLLIGISLTDMVSLATDSVLKVTTTNLNGRSTPAKVTVTLFKLTLPDRAFKPRSWQRPDLSIMTRENFHALYPYDIYGDENNPATWAKEKTIFEKTINTSTDSLINLSDPGSRIPDPGSYQLVLKTTDPFGTVVEKSQVFTAFSPGSKEVPVNTLNWFVPLKTSGVPGESARFLVGSKEDNITMIYEIRLRDSLISRETIRLSDRAMPLDIPILEKYRGNFTVNFVFIKHNRVFQNSTVVNVPYADKKLGISFETFRNKLDPGTQETWKINIARANGKPAGAEFMAGMYDASLDQFRPNNWFFNIYQHYSGLSPWNIDQGFRTSTSIGRGRDDSYENYSSHPALKLNWFGLNYFGSYSRRLLSARGAMDKSMDMELKPNEAPPAPKQESNVEATDITSSGETTEEKPKPQTSPGLQIRRDFRETAFFYPSMVTDSSGNLILQFTVPESLTKWKLLGLAHTKNLEYGLVEKEVVTRKDLMVFPNAPRFVRQGDTIVLSTKIVNLSGNDLSGEVTLSLADAITLQSLNNLIDSIPYPASRIPYPASRIPNELPRIQIFSVAKDQSTFASWKLVIPANTDLSVLQYRITAVSGNFSDGEEKAIPVLTNRMLVTESLPLPVRGKGTTEFTFDKLLKEGQTQSGASTLKNYKLTLEFASNPVWYAIQALPSLNDKQYDNADAIFAAYWSNNLAAFIANSNPKIKAVFETWKNLTPDALLSNLAKNQQLKSALLQETPWVAEATSETGRKQKLGLYFDMNTIDANLKENLIKLQKLQTPNGGWTWFAGMPENRYTTQNILTGMGRLHHLGVTNILKDATTRDMVLKAIGYLDGELRKDYENLKKYNSGHLDDNHIGSAQIQYLFARSYFMNDPAFQIPDPGSKFKEAFGYYVKQAEKFWQPNDRSLQGMIALALNRLDRKDVPALIIKSLSEKALHSPEMGMYWAGETGFWWHQAPIETQALMIELFDELAQDPARVEDLKIWLLKQKQTQDWRSVHATLEACYALLLRGTDLLSDDSGVKISLGKEKISSASLTDVSKEAGTGYFQYTWSGNEITPDMGKISVSKSSAGVAWGAVYWQYFENLDKITPAATPMRLEKKLFLEKNTPTGPVLEPISKDEEQRTNSGSPVSLNTCLLKTGDKVVVRIVLTVDRDLEFVHMKDMRASAFEPVNTTSNSLARQGGNSGDGLSGYRFQDGLGYYQSTSDLATSFFFDNLPKGTYVFEYALKVNAAGEYSNGITTIQCMYAPEFAAHSEGIRISVK